MLSSFSNYLNKIQALLIFSPVLSSHTLVSFLSTLHDISSIFLLSQSFLCAFWPMINSYILIPVIECFLLLLASTEYELPPKTLPGVKAVLTSCLRIPKQRRNAQNSTCSPLSTFKTLFFYVFKKINRTPFLWGPGNASILPWIFPGCFYLGNFFVPSSQSLYSSLNIPMTSIWILDLISKF